MSVTQTVDIPDNHRLTIEVPREVPAGRTVLTFTPAQEHRSDDENDGLNFIGDCPLCAAYRDPKTGELIPNAETAAAIREGRAMMRGEIPAKRFSSLEDLLSDLRS